MSDISNFIASTAQKKVQKSLKVPIQLVGSTTLGHGNPFAGVFRTGCMMGTKSHLWKYFLDPWDGLAQSFAALGGCRSFFAGPGHVLSYSYSHSR